VFVPSSGSPGLVGHLRNVLFHSVISSPLSFCRPRAVRKVRPPPIDIGSLLATPLFPLFLLRSPAAPFVAKVQQDDREKSFRIGREENGPAMAMRATGRLPVFATIPRCSRIRARTFICACTHALTYRRASTREAHYACTPPLRGDAPRAPQVAFSRAHTHARTHAYECAWERRR